MDFIQNGKNVSEEELVFVTITFAPSYLAHSILFLFLALSLSLVW